VSRVNKYLKHNSQRVSPHASIFLTAVLEFLASELLENASEVTTSMKRKQISINDLNRSVWGDRDWNIVKKPSKKRKNPSNDDESSVTAVATESNKSTSKRTTFSGDHDLKMLAENVNWGSLKNGWKGVYTESKRHKYKVPTNPVEFSEPLTTAVVV